MRRDWGLEETRGPPNLTADDNGDSAGGDAGDGMLSGTVCTAVAQHHECISNEYVQLSASTGMLTSCGGSGSPVTSVSNALVYCRAVCRVNVLSSDHAMHAVAFAASYFKVMAPFAASRETSTP
jgi:hypothetical protein